MRLVAVLWVTIAALSPSYAQVDLNADGAKKVTVASEIRRGADIIRAVNVSGAFMSESNAMDAEVQRNHQANKDSDGFMLGANFYQWVKYDFWARQPVSNVHSAANKNLAELYAKERFKQWRKTEQTFGLSEEKLCELVGVKFDAIKPMIERYERSTTP